MATFNIGILFNAFVTATIAGTAIALVFFFRKRWDRLDESMRAYAWFWWFTAIVWAPSSLRYLVVSSGYAGPEMGVLDLLVQGGVFFTGPSLFYYLGLRVFGNRAIAQRSAVVSMLLAVLSMWFTSQPNGIPLKDVTTFSAEATVNQISFIIFSVQASIIFALLVFDTVRRLRIWKTRGMRQQLYHALYSAALLVYLSLGSIDESKVITDWPIVVFRLLYTGAFLMVYLVITQDEDSRAEFLQRSSPSNSQYGNTNAT